MRVLGIDPGTIHMGFGIVEQRQADIALIHCGVLEAPQRDPIERRLLRIFTQLQALIAQHAPDTIAVEEPFVVKAARNSALAVGEARAIALLAAAGAGLPVSQYTPSKVRSTVIGYGAGDKEQVRQMVSMLLGASLESFRLDASDALAVAICHLRHAAIADLISTSPAPARRPATGLAARRNRA